jgi:hypothetical protein
VRARGCDYTRRFKPPSEGPLFFAAVETTRLIPTHTGTTIIAAID